jgi:hypothetical protein
VVYHVEETPNKGAASNTFLALLKSVSPSTDHTNLQFVTIIGVATLDTVIAKQL